MEKITYKLNIGLHENQQKIQDSRARFKVIKAGRRFGKTKLGCYQISRSAGLNNNEVFWYIAPTYRQAKDIAWWDLKMMLPKETIKSKLENELMLVISSDSRIILKGAENEDSLRGSGLKGVIFDECAYIKEHVWTDIVRPQLIDSKGWAIFISTPKGKNWFTKLFDEATRKKKNGDKEWDAFHFTTYDNPLLDRKEIEKMKETMTDEKYLQEIMAEEQDYIGQMYHEFDYDRNVEKCLSLS